MENEEPQELTFGFAIGESETDESTPAPAPPKIRRPTGVPIHPKIAELRPTETSESEDHAAELKRRVAELRTASRKSKTGRRPVAPKAPVEAFVPLDRVPAHIADVEPVDESRSVEFDVSTLDPIYDAIDEPIEEIDDVVDDAITIATFYERVKRALAYEFTEEIWVSGEIRGFRESRGHRYLEMADKGVEVVGRGVAQQLEVVCWARDWPPIARALSEAGVDLEVGRVIRVRGKVSVWEGGSKLRFTLTALDVEALVGGIAATRRRLLAALAEENLLEANRRIPLTLVPLRIGIVTSPGSEAHRDFVGQLERSGFAFKIHLEQSLVQGTEAPAQIASALWRMQQFEPELVVVVRGGGARGDLAAFDDELVARAIANAPFPVWTGIGHTSDRSVADEVAQRSLITPTACGEAVVEVVDAYWGGALRRMETASRLARNHLDGAKRHVATSANLLVQSVRHQLGRRSDGLLVAKLGVSRAANAKISHETANIDRRILSLQASGPRSVVTQENNLVRHRQVLNAFDPARQLERGWSLVHDEQGHLVRSIDQLKKGDQLRTRLLGGHAVSVVGEVERDTTDVNTKKKESGE